MDFNLVTQLESCTSFIQENADFVKLVYYSHIPTAIAGLLIGCYVFLKRRDELISKLLLSLSVVFSLWVLFNFLSWTSTDSRVIMFSWSLLGILDALIFTLSLYFVYVYIDQKDISFRKKVILGGLLLPILLFTPTAYNLSGFNVTLCEAVENFAFVNYYYFVSLGIFLWILGVAADRYRKADNILRRQIVLLSIGMLFFLASFAITGYMASFLDNFFLEIYGLFGMVFFMLCLAYLIVRYQAFNIKLFSVQALVTALILIIASQLLFVENTTNFILIQVSLLLVLIASITLVRTVRLDIERKEELQRMADALAAANDELRRLDTAKSEFISIASHQLRTPLTAIKGFLSLLLEGSYGQVSSAVEDVLNKMYLANQRIIDLVENLLSISRIESGRMEYRYEAIQVEDIVKELVDSFLIMAKTKKLTLEMRLSTPPLLKIFADPQKLREVISNLIDNAIKYTPEGSVRVEVIEESERVLIVVADSGVGIAREELPSLFGKFSRGRDSNRMHANGTGLGLYVSKQLIEAQGGRVWVESEGAGKGSRFVIALPKERKAEKKE